MQNKEFKAKVVGLKHHKVVESPEKGEYLILRAEPKNEKDGDAIAVFNGDNELIGYIANSKYTIKDFDIIRGIKSASQLKKELDWKNKEYYAEIKGIIKNKEISLLLNPNQWGNLRKTPQEEEKSTKKEEKQMKATKETKKPIKELKEELKQLKQLKKELKQEKQTIKEELKRKAIEEAIVKEKQTIKALKQEIKSLKQELRGEGVKTPSKTSNKENKEEKGRILSVVGLSHFDGQDNLKEGVKLEIVEEPIFKNAKGTAMYLKCGEHRLGVFPSKKKEEYCKEHNIPYYENKEVKKMSFDNVIIKIQKMVYDEYCTFKVQ